VQLTSGGHSILLDAGSPLGESRSNVDLSKLDFTDVFISHPHMDHYGMIEGLDQSKTVHIGPMAKELITILPKFLMDKKPINNNFQTLEWQKKVKVGPFQVTPYLMDHSSYDAYGFLVEADGKRVYYSGDFRTHGNRGDKLRCWLENNHPKDVDVMLMEGTMMGRDNLRFKTEKDVKAGMVEVLEKTNGPCFLIGSGQHIDRLYMASLACRDAHPTRKFVTDIYTGYILYFASKIVGGIPSILTRPDVCILTEGRTYNAHKKALEKYPDYFAEFITAMIQPGKTVGFKDVMLNGQEYFLKVSNMGDFLKRLKEWQIDCGVVYSQWSGYRKSEYDSEQAKKFKEIEDLVGSENFHKVHTSGHAVREDLDWFSKLINPKTLIPIHTERKDAYPKQFDTLNVTLLGDGEIYEV